MKRALLPLFIVFVTLVSCNDATYAVLLEGTWNRSFVIPYEDGTKSHLDEYITFKKVGDNDGGSFTEISTGQEEFDEEDINGTYRWVSSIKGTWEIIFGTIYFHYDISSLEVKVRKDEVKYKLDYNSYSFNEEYYLSRNLYKTLQKNTYKSLFKYYKEMNKQDDDGLGYTIIVVNSNTMSYSAKDGNYTFCRYEFSVPTL